MRVKTKQYPLASVSAFILLFLFLMGLAVKWMEVSKKLRIKGFHPSRGTRLPPLKVEGPNCHFWQSLGTLSVL